MAVPDPTSDGHDPRSPKRQAPIVLFEKLRVVHRTGRRQRLDHAPADEQARRLEENAGERAREDGGANPSEDLQFARASSRGRDGGIDGVKEGGDKQEEVSTRHERKQDERGSQDHPDGFQNRRQRAVADRRVADAESGSQGGQGPGQRETPCEFPRPHAAQVDADGHHREAAEQERRRGEHHRLPLGCGDLTRRNRREVEEAQRARAHFLGDHVGSGGDRRERDQDHLAGGEDLEQRASEDGEVRIRVAPRVARHLGPPSQEDAGDEPDVDDPADVILPATG